MLQPRRVKFRKHHRGHRRGMANAGNEVSNGSSPQPSGGGAGESNGNPGNEVSNGATPQPSGG